MQLAAPHRPHPPPVPPRPSRQVVAEALKRTSKLPCPTRQAPPPPNTKPWRPDDKCGVSTAGRTLIYESSKDRQVTKSIDRTSDLEKTQESRCRSERIENNRERQQQQQLSESVVNGNGNFSEFTSKTGSQGNYDPRVLPNRKNVVTSNFIQQVSRVQGTDDTPTAKFCNEQAFIEIDKRVDTIEHHSKEDRKDIESSVNKKKSSSISTLIDKTKVEVIKEDQQVIIDSITDEKLRFGSLETTISTDDCATVVVVEEPEHKITINEDNKDNIQHQDWLEAGVRYSSTKITLPGDDTISHHRTNEYDDTDRENFGDDNENEERIKFDLDFSSIRERIAMSSLQGLPPLPRSLSGFNLSEGRRDSSGEPPPPPTRSSSKTSKSNKIQQQSGSRPSPPSRQLTTLDTQLAILRKEMFGLRQLDLSLLSQLWSLNESIQEFRQLLQEQEDRAPSSSPSSEDGDESNYHGHVPPPPRRPAPLLHHHRPPRPPRPLRPPPSDDSPSSEEYGAV